MIHAVGASEPGFRTVKFLPGLNVILAERAETSTERDTRNGVGKSSLLEVIDFCLGSEPKKGKGLLKAEIAKWSFWIELDIDDHFCRVTRSPESPKVIYVASNAEFLSALRPRRIVDGVAELSVDDWRASLGSMFFGLPRSEAGQRFRPSYRSLMSYFIRTGSGAYLSPFKYLPVQKAWSVEANISYLLDLAWDIAGDQELLRIRKNTLSALDKALKNNAISKTIGGVGELETERLRLSRQLAAERQAIDSFQVHPQYSRLRDEANELTSRISTLNNQLVLDRDKLRLYRESIASESPPTEPDLESIYREAAVLFPEGVRRTIEEARTFHKKLIRNRHSFLRGEIRNLEQRINDSETERRALTDHRASILGLLRTHGALEEYTALQENVAKSREQLERVSARVEELKNLRTNLAEVKIEKIRLQERAQREYDERRVQWGDCVVKFNEHSEYLYQVPGRLIIDVTDEGYRFDVQIERSDSHGIEKMKIFCFDLMLAARWAARKSWFGSLIHDSLMFDGVDSRQRAGSLELAAKRCEEYGFQYICAMNSDMVPHDDFSEGFDFMSSVRVTLRDDPAEESLFGFRF